jgi:hypothetical protein
MKLWLYYTNVYYKYIHVSFNINLMKFIIILKILLHHLRFFKIIILGGAIILICTINSWNHYLIFWILGCKNNINYKKKLLNFIVNTLCTYNKNLESI